MPHHSSRKKQSVDPRGIPHGVISGGNAPHRTMVHVQPYHPASVYMGRPVSQIMTGSWTSHSPTYSASASVEVPLREDASVNSAPVSADYRRVGTTPNDDFRGPTLSCDSPQQATASALVMASKRVTPKEDASRPLKKRKNIDDIHRTRSRSPCYVSPMSAKFPPRSASESSSRASSYDSKDGEALPESAKVNDTKEIAPQMERIVRNLPAILHKVLSDEEYGQVLQWLPHGKSWRIVRFDALRKQVLPKYFPQLCENGDGSIDAFMKQLTLWGFEEVTDGPDVGAYSNLLFRQGVPQLAVEMKVAEPEMKIVPLGGNKGAPRSILRVPSLVSSTGTVETVPSKDESKEDFKEDDSRRNRLVYTSNRGRRPSSITGVRYRADPMAEGWTNSYSETDRNRHRGIPYSPIRVRSARGSTAMARPLPPDHHHHRPSFPMSSRGRASGRGLGGRVIPAGRRPSFVPSISPVRASANCADAISGRMNNRKLPMATKSSAALTEEEES